MRSVNPDHDRLGGNAATMNQVLANFDIGGAAAAVRATGPVSGVPLFFFTKDPRARAAHGGFSNSDAFASFLHASPPATGVVVNVDISISMTIVVGCVRLSNRVAWRVWLFFLERTQITTNKHLRSLPAATWCQIHRNRSRCIWCVRSERVFRRFEWV